MDKLPHPLLLEILSRLDNSADVARCRVASKAFDDVSPYLRSINLRYSRWFWDPSNPLKSKWFSISSSRFKRIFLDLISKQETVESVSISLYDGYMYEVDFAKEWMPRVSKSLKSLSLSSWNYHYRLDKNYHYRLDKPNIMPLISSYCHNLVNLELKDASLPFVINLNPMPMLTSLTLESIELEDEHLNEFNKCFPNLQHLKLVDVRGLEDPKIHLLNLQTCHLFFYAYNYGPPLTLITPNLISLRIKSVNPAAIHVKAPMLSHFHLDIFGLIHEGVFTAKKFEKLKTLWLGSIKIGSLLSKFPMSKTLENLTLDAPRYVIDSKLTLRKVFMVFPNVTSLCIKANVWSGLEVCLNPEGWEILDGRKGLKTICAYLRLVDPSLTFSFVAFVLDQCEDLTEVSLLIHYGVDGTKSNNFMSKCMARWPGLKWRWGVWRKGMKDIYMGGSNDLRVSAPDEVRSVLCHLLSIILMRAFNTFS